jgi:tRNA (Thr-GGU) A37 N-methylase
LTGVFATRSPERPNPIGLHRVTVLEVDKDRGIRVRPLEAVDGTPVVDIKPVMRESRKGEADLQTGAEQPQHPADTRRRRAEDEKG